MSRGRFRVDPSVPANVLASSDSPSELITFQVVLPPSELGLVEPTLGNFSYDVRSLKYNMLWGSWQDFDLFLAQEQLDLSVEFHKVQTRAGNKGKYTQRHYYVCARHGTGGSKAGYMKKNPHWERKVPSKITGCSASLTVKSYPGTDYLLGVYDAGHDHAVGPENLRFTRISSSTRDWIAALVRTHVKTKEIVCCGVCLEISHCILISVSSLDCCRSGLEATFRIQRAITS
jgi:hypothetical protein